ncbi:MAG: hypothetical protein J6Y37_01935 [Paludibacteraceae bacterium]|nr:hypothetical protein [Paludibacteraceae bacterium]
MKAPIRFVKVGKKKIQVWFDNFEYYQPNDHICGDCGIRAVSKALNCTWKESLAKLYESALKLQEAPESRECISDVLTSNGFVWIPTSPKKGEKRPTVSGFMKSHQKGTYVFNVSSHVVCGADGKYYDIWDSGSKSLYGYWAKE